MKEEGTIFSSRPGTLQFRHILIYMSMITLLIAIVLCPNKTLANDIVQEITTYEENAESLPYTGSWERIQDNRA